MSVFWGVLIGLALSWVLMFTWGAKLQRDKGVPLKARGISSTESVGEQLTAVLTNTKTGDVTRVTN